MPDLAFDNKRELFLTMLCRVRKSSSVIKRLRRPRLCSKMSQRVQGENDSVSNKWCA